MTKTLYIAWQDPEGRSWCPVGRVRFDPPDQYEFRYLEGARRAGEHPGFPGIAQFGDLELRYTASELFPFLKNRVISSSRGDYSDYAVRMGLQPGEVGHTLHTFDILRRSAGRRATDRFEVFAGPAIEDGHATFVFFLRGVRYLDEELQRHWENRRPDEPLRALLDPYNPVDEDATIIASDALAPLGFVPRYYSEPISGLVRGGAELELELVRHNPPPAPTHERFLVKLRAAVAPDWSYPSSAEFEVIEARDHVAA